MENEKLNDKENEKFSSLDEFLELTDISEIRKTITVRGSNGKLYKMQIRPLTRDEHSDFQKRSTVITGKKSNFDTGKYAQLACDACIVQPNFKSAEFLQKAVCVSASDFLQRKFAAGTLMDISGEIQTLSGFQTLEEDIEEAKN